MLRRHLKRLGEEILGRAAQARQVLHESDFRAAHGARVRGEDSNSRADPAESAANVGQDRIEPGPTPVGAGIGFPPGSHSAHAGHCRNLLTKRIVHASVEELRHGRKDVDCRPICLQRKAARVRQDQEVVADGSLTSRAGERPPAFEAGVYRAVTGRLYFPQCTQAQWGEEEWLHLDGQLPQRGAEEIGRGIEAAEALIFKCDVRWRHWPRQREG